MAWSSFAPLAFFRRNVDVFDRPLLLITLVLMAISMLTMLSAAADFPARTEAHARNLLLSLALMWLVDRKSTRLNSSHSQQSRMPSSA